MGFLDQVEKIQKKPRALKEKILALSVIAIMAAVIVIWSQTVRQSFTKNAPEDGAVNPLKSLWSTAREGFKNAFDSINF